MLIGKSHVSVCDYLSKPSDNAPEKCVTAQPHHVGVSMIHEKVVNQQNLLLPVLNGGPNGSEKVAGLGISK